MEHISPSLKTLGDLSIVTLEEDNSVDPPDIAHVEIIQTASPDTAHRTLDRKSPYIEILTESSLNSPTQLHGFDFNSLQNDQKDYFLSSLSSELSRSPSFSSKHPFTSSDPISQKNIDSVNNHPPVAMRSQSLDESHTIREVVVLKPGEDVQAATNRALSNITENLNRKAGESIARGHTPVKETVIEITSITPSDTGYFSRDELLKKNLERKLGKSGRGRRNNRTTRRRPASQPVGSPPFALAEFERECHTPPTTFTAVPPVSSARGCVHTPTALRPTASQTSAAVQQCSSNKPDANKSSVTSTDMLDSFNCQSVPSIHKSNLQVDRENKTNSTEDHNVWESEMQMAKDKCSVLQRPPHSYQQLIQMALSSRPDLTMTLKDIYRWIEDTFPYYKDASRQGWRNSIRHNLSLNKMFVRDKLGAEKDSKSTCSYWRLVPAEARAKSEIQLPVASELDKLRIIQRKDIPGQDVRRGKPLLLPKMPGNTSLSAPMQTYALIPIQGGIPVIPNQPIMVTPAFSSQVASASDLLASNKPAINAQPQKRQHSPAPKQQRKQVKIAPLLPEQHLNTSANRSLSSSLNTTDLGAQLAKIRFDSTLADSGIECSRSGEDDLSVEENTQSLEVKGTKIIPGIPKPKMYGNTGRKTPAILRRQRPVTMAVSASSGSEKKSPPLVQKSKSSRKSELGQLAADEAMSFPVIPPVALRESHNKDTMNMLLGITSPVKELLCTPPRPTVRMTSTPIEGEPMLEDISPIRGLTPLTAENLLDSGIFTPPPHDYSMESYQLESTPDSKNPAFGRSPKPGSLRDLGLPGLTPIKGQGSPKLTGFTPPIKMPLGYSTGLTPVRSSLTPTKSPPANLDTSKSPCSAEGDSLHNQSFTKLLGDFHLESFMDEPASFINDISWSMLQ